MDDFAKLRLDVDRLGRALGAAIRAVSGEALYGVEEEIRGLAKALRHGPDAAKEARLRAVVSGLSVSDAEGVARAFAIYFHLVNLAEERHRVRMNRAREATTSLDAPRSESFRALVGELARRGHDAASVARLLTRVELVSTFTAHPTESRRRTVRLHLNSLRRVLDGLEGGAASEDELEAVVSLLWATDELRQVRPSVEDEVRAGLAYLPTTLAAALPRVAAGLERAIEERFGERVRVAAPVSFRSWIGGDRDGNPNVTPDVTSWAQAYARERGVRMAIEDVERLIEALSAADRWVEAPPAIAAALEAARDVPLPDRFADEPFRRFLLVVRARLRALLGEAGPEGYASDDAYRADLANLVAALDASHLERAASRVVGPAWVRAKSFGLGLVRLDLRDESSQHAKAAAELLRVGGVCADYLALDKAARSALLRRELETSRPLAPVGYEPEGRELQLALGSMRAFRARGAYVISMAHEPVDVLEVFLFAREVGLYHPGRALPFDVVPLFEMLEDLSHADRVVRALLDEPIFHAHVLERGGMEVMIGYSDSNKDAGFLAANWILAVAQDAITRAARERGVRVSYFHGRGTSTARGGGPAGRALVSLPEGTVGDRIRLTEQGEALADRYEDVDLAVRHLEQLLYYFVLAADRDARLEAPSELSSERRAWLDRAAARSTEAYRGLLAMPGFFPFFEALTPIGELAALKIASRPVYRHGHVHEVSDLRAIPWVMCWTQVRANLPGWFGVGAGLAEIPRDVRRALYREWPLFRSILDSAAIGVSTSDLRVTRGYARLADPADVARFFPVLEAEWARTKSLLEETFEGELLQASPTLRRQIELRNPYVDPLNHVQIELLARVRALPAEHPDRERVERALLTTILGIAAGVRNVG